MAWQPCECVRSRQALASGGVYARHCSTAFIKHVFPKLESPGPAPRISRHSSKLRSASGGKRWRDGGGGRLSSSAPAEDTATTLPPAAAAAAAAPLRCEPPAGGLSTLTRRLVGMRTLSALRALTKLMRRGRAVCAPCSA